MDVIALSWSLSAALVVGLASPQAPSAAPNRAPAPCKVFGTFVQQYDGLERPTVVAVSTTGDFAVLERDQRRVRVFTVDGRERWTIESQRSAESAASAWDLAVGADPVGPTAMAFRADNRLTILSPTRMAIFDVDGATPSTATSTSSPSPWRVVAGLDLGEPGAAAWKTGDPANEADDELWIADRTGSVLVLRADASVVRRITAGATRPFLRPSGVAIASDGSVFVADEDADAIIRLDGAGRELARFGERGSFPGLFNAPRGLAVLGDCLYVTDELNHRVTIHAYDGTFRSFWGMHAVVPREGEGKIHYPTAVAFAPDGAFAYVAEPFERRVQRFATSDPDAALNAAMPSREGVLSHFGGAIACDGELLLLEEPESSSVFLFDLREPTPIHVTTFGGSGPGPDRFSRVSAMHVDKDSQRAVIADTGARRLAQIHVARDRKAPLKMDPFMARLVRSWDLVPWTGLVRELLSQAPAATPSSGTAVLELVGFARQGQALWTIDRVEGLLIELDASLRPTRVMQTGCVGANGLVALADGGFATTRPDRGEVIFLSNAGTVTRTLGGRSDASTPSRFVRPTAIAAMPDGTLVVTDAGSDEVLALDAEGKELQRIGKRGASDGQLWMPDGIAHFTGANAPQAGEEEGGQSDKGPRFVVIDRGNHRAQIFRQDGTWLMTFGLGRAYTRPRERGET
jgi:DNA-binding beta-propeller fold protein YncE